MQITGIIRPSETDGLTVEAEDYQDSRTRLEAQIPDGWQLIQTKTS
ncbi:hypothetical protein SPF06_19005 [Sinomonas sp. JGH33]|uniref:Uncharacterized protein n=1 Tax=Sinomonas terricola TaxID=3110330 RepID=A0ABU5TAW0_9MICC|nr:hypothetical protein [Sinomonas sp. JGH33]MEA5456817.1 hypothetical protein [Sinomonas sp. JGH33]